MMRLRRRRVRVDRLGGIVLVHPRIYDRVRRLPRRDITLDHYDRTRAHHRDEIRRLKTAAFAHLDSPRPVRPFNPCAGAATCRPAS